MADQELEALLTELESDRLERKSSVADAGKIKRAMCALANDLPGHDKPGVIFVGINDDGSRVHHRIEVSSPGGPYGQVTPENFGCPGITDYRNPHVAEAMKVLGYAQRFGFGIAIARQELAKNGNPPIEFSVTDTHVLAVIRRRP